MKPDIGLHERLRCPGCHHAELRLVDDGRALMCTGCATEYPVLQGRPVLLRSDNLVFPPRTYVALPRAPIAKRPWRSFVPGPSVNLAGARCLTGIGIRLAQREHAHVLVVGGGTQRLWLDDRFKSFRNIRLIYCDVDATALVDCYCDAHELPFVDGCFDAVITTAVLEHVLYPERAVVEIYRVLAPDGLLYSEMPFMQQVHEGAYDFTRYTLSGHRRLFNRFTEIDSGMAAGPATALYWAIENFALSFFAGRHARVVSKACVRTAFFWIKYLDYLLRDKPQAMDGASCTYFLGSKRGTTVPDKQIIENYVGAKQARGL